MVSLAVAASLTNPYGDAQELEAHGPWQIGVFAAGGFPPNYELYQAVAYPGGAYSQFAIVQLDLLNAGAQIGKVLSAPRGPGFLRGQGRRSSR